MSGEHEAWMVTLVETTDPPSIRYKGPFLSEKAAKDLVEQATQQYLLAMHQKLSIPHSMYKRMKQLGMK